MFKDATTLKELERMVAQLHISHTAITFRGKDYAVTPENALQSLAGILYSECYALKESHQQGLVLKEEYNKDNSFLALLSAGNHTLNRLEPGWKVSNNYSNGYVEITRNGQIQIVPVTALEGISASSTFPAEQEFTVFFPKEDRLRQPTFYYVFSNRHIDTTQRMTRVYWNISSEGAAVLVEAVTKKLNHYNIPFLFKCLSHPSFYFRRDAAVLYVDDAMMPMLSFILPEIYEEVKQHLEEDVPLFTFKYKKGIGIAENPTTEESFGMNRMAAVAGALMDTSIADQVQAIAAAFLEKGINPDTPYLNKGSKTLLN